MENQIQTQRVSVANFLNAPSTSKFLQETLSEKKQEFVSNLIALTDADSSLAQCDPAQLMKCAMNATALNLPLNKNLGYAYVIAYKQNGVPVPQFQIGYKGLIQLAIRTGQYRFINATEIREGEIRHNKITGEVIFNGDKPSNPVVGYMAYIEMVNGFTASLYMSNEQIEEHATRFSKTYQNDKKYGKTTSKWSDPLSRPAMCKKTVLKGLLGTYGLMTTEFAKALDNDGDEEPSTGNRNGKFEEAEVVQQSEPRQAAQEVEEQPEPSETPVKVKI